MTIVHITKETKEELDSLLPKGIKKKSDFYDKVVKLGIAALSGETVPEPKKQEEVEAKEEQPEVSVMDIAKLGLFITNSNNRPDSIGIMPNNLVPPSEVLIAAYTEEEARNYLAYVDMPDSTAIMSVELKKGIQGLLKLPRQS